MIRKTMRIRVLGLSLLAIAGLMAFMAASASANWLESLATMTANREVIVESHSEYLTLLVPAETNLEIECLKIKGEDLLLIGNSEKGTGEVEFSECETWQNGLDITANCQPAEPIVAAGKALLILHNNKNYILLTPPDGSTRFTQIKFNPATCALPETNNVKGSLTAECGQLEGGAFVGKDCAEDTKERLLQINQSGLFTDRLTYGTKEAFIDGSVEVKLASGNFWAGHV